jgi:hypothetical protein
MIWLRCGELKISQAAESVIAPPNPSIVWYVVPGFTDTTVPVLPDDPNVSDGCLATALTKPLPDVVVNHACTFSFAACAHGVAMTTVNSGADSATQNRAARSWARRDRPRLSPSILFLLPV